MEGVGLDVFGAEYYSQCVTHNSKYIYIYIEVVLLRSYLQASKPCLCTLVEVSASCNLILRRFVIRGLNLAVLYHQNFNN